MQKSLTSLVSRDQQRNQHCAVSSCLDSLECRCYSWPGRSLPRLASNSALFVTVPTGRHAPDPRHGTVGAHAHTNGLQTPRSTEQMSVEVFLSPSGQIQGSYFESGKGHFLLYKIRFIIPRYNYSDIEGVVRWKTKNQQVRKETRGIP